MALQIKAARPETAAENQIREGRSATAVQPPS
jgi:hypothetical protein